MLAAGALALAGLEGPFGRIAPLTYRLFPNLFLTAATFAWILTLDHLMRLVW